MDAFIIGTTSPDDKPEPEQNGFPATFSVLRKGKGVRDGCGEVLADFRLFRKAGPGVNRLLHFIQDKVVLSA